MATITGASARQLYDMTYRLANQRATVTRVDGGAVTGTIHGGTWKKTSRSTGPAESLKISTDGGPSMDIKFAHIASIELGR